MRNTENCTLKSNALAYARTVVGAWCVVGILTLVSPGRVWADSPLIDGPPPVVTAASIKDPSEVADRIQNVSEFLNKLGVAYSVGRSLRGMSDRIIGTLADTGQNGVLVYMAVLKYNTDVDTYGLLGDDLQFLGAGTSAQDVLLAWVSQKKLLPEKSAGTTLDEDVSSFLWFSRSGSQLRVDITPAELMWSDVRREISDQQLLSNLDAESQARALQDAANYIASEARYHEANNRMAKAVRDRIETERKVEDVRRKLDAALEEAAAADQVSRQFATMRGVLTLAQQILEIKDIMGDRAPPALTKSKTEDDLGNVIRDWAANVSAETANVRIEYDKAKEEKNGIVTKQVTILIDSGYPVSKVPQLEAK
jgi:hypothetical protein